MSSRTPPPFCVLPDSPSGERANTSLSSARDTMNVLTQAGISRQSSLHTLFSDFTGQTGTIAPGVVRNGAHR